MCKYSNAPSVLSSQIQCLVFDVINSDGSSERKSVMVHLPHIIDHEVHNALGHKVTDAFVDDGHVGVHQVADGLHLPLQLRIHREVL